MYYIHMILTHILLSSVVEIVLSHLCFEVFFRDVKYPKKMGTWFIN